MGKRENVGDQHFLLFPQCFLFFLKQISNFGLSSANALNLDWFEMSSLGKELTRLESRLHNTAHTHQAMDVN